MKLINKLVKQYLKKRSIAVAVANQITSNITNLKPPNLRTQKSRTLPEKQQIKPKENITGYFLRGREGA